MIKFEVKAIDNDSLVDFRSNEVEEPSELGIHLDQKINPDQIK